MIPALIIAVPFLLRLAIHEIYMARLDYMDRTIQSRSVSTFLRIES